MPPLPDSLGRFRCSRDLNMLIRTFITSTSYTRPPFRDTRPPYTRTTRTKCNSSIQALDSKLRGQALDSKLRGQALDSKLRGQAFQQPFQQPFQQLPMLRVLPTLFYQPP